MDSNCSKGYKFLPRSQQQDLSRSTSPPPDPQGNDITILLSTHHHPATQGTIQSSQHGIFHLGLNRKRSWKGWILWIRMCRRWFGKGISFQLYLFWISTLNFKGVHMNTPPKRCREQNEMTLPIKEKVKTPRRGVSKKEMFCFSFRDVRDVTKLNLQLAQSNRFLLSLPKEEMIRMMTPFPKVHTLSTCSRQSYLNQTSQDTFRHWIL